MSRAITLSLILVIGVAGFAAGRWWPGSAMPEANTSADPAPASARQPLYYRNPMGLPDTSPVPKKDPMGMDYIAVYPDDAGPSDAGEVRVSPGKLQTLGVRTAAVARAVVTQTVHAAGQVVADEARIHRITPRFEGYVRTLMVNLDGQPVQRGQALFSVYSPEVASAAREYAIASKGLRALSGGDSAAREGMHELMQAARQRLANWDVPPDQINAIASGRDDGNLMLLRSPVDGVVTARNVLQGSRFMPGDLLYEVTDLSSVWVLADVFEQDVAQVHVGQTASVVLNGYPDDRVDGTVTYLYPTLNTQTRTLPVRIELPNPDGRLRPGMYADVALTATGSEAQLVIPDSAVIDSGRQQTVLLAKGEGRFVPKVVTLGRHAGDQVVVRDGLADGDEVVVSANFLLDAESNLKAALASLAPDTSTAPEPAPVLHHAHGDIVAIDAESHSLTIHHQPIASLNWPAMTMDFSVADDALLTGVSEGATVDFDFHEAGDGDWQIVAMTAVPSASTRQEP